MTAQDVLKMAFDCGVLIQVKGDKLHLEAKEAPPNHLVAEIRHYKADLIALLAANDPVKNESYPPLEDGQLNRKSADKQSPKNLGDALKTEQTTAPNFRDTFTPTAETSAVEQQPPFSLNNYSHCVTCNQCEHLSLTGTCSRLGKRVNPQAMRECGSFQLLKKERPQIEEVKPYTHAELKALLNQVAKPLYFHLIDCEQCSLEDARYCSDGMTLGSRFDDLLLCFDDAADKRYKLMNQVIKARVSGRRAFES
ncbi:MAG TPA: hypothetical protein PK633_08805, partial [Agitococcus sp.]|nr:hypothetical protein [Agitococcus sp.]